MKKKSCIEKPKCYCFRIDFEKIYKSINKASFFVITYEIIDSTFIDITLASYLTLKKKSSFFMTESGDRLGLLFAVFSVILIVLKLVFEFSLSREMNQISKDIYRLKREFKPREEDENGNEIFKEETHSQKCYIQAPNQSKQNNENLK